MLILLVNSKKLPAIWVCGNLDRCKQDPQIFLAKYFSSSFLVRSARVWPDAAFPHEVGHIANPTESYWLGWLRTGMGRAIMVLLLLARRIWVWWPLHPIGSPKQVDLALDGVQRFSCLADQGADLALWRGRTYCRLRSFPLGIILGHFIFFGVFWIISCFTGMIGNSLFI